MIEAIKTTMAREWANVRDEFEPEQQADMKKWVWSYVARYFMSIESKGER